MAKNSPNFTINIYFAVYADRDGFYEKTIVGPDGIEKLVKIPNSQLGTFEDSRGRMFDRWRK